jgi:pimeloyl-ACP methyl ester carboxylesterase
LPGLLKGPVGWVSQLSVAFPDRTVVAIELPGLGGSALTGPFSVSKAVALVRDWLITLGEPFDLIACDASLPIALELGRSAASLRRLAWLDADCILPWPASEDSLEELPLSESGAHLLKLWSHLRRRDLVRPDDPRRARTSGTYLSADELDEALLCFGMNTQGYSDHWNHGVNACRALQPSDMAMLRRCESIDEAAAYLEHAGDSPQRLFPVPQVLKSRVIREYVDVSRGRVHLRRAGGGDRLLLAFLAGAGSSANLEPLLTGLSHSRLVVAPDYLGQGDSCRDTTPTTVAQLARDADEIATALGYSSYDVYGTHTGAGVAIEAAIAFPDRVGKVIIDGISMQDPTERAEHREKYFPVIQPDVWGSHVHKAWNVRWDGGYFWPWYRPEPKTARSGRAPSLPLLHDRVMSTLRSQTTPAYQAIASYAARERLAMLRRPAMFVAGPSDTFVTHMESARAVAQSNVTFKHVEATVWFAGQDSNAVKNTLQVFEHFLDSTGTTGT